MFAFIARQPILDRQKEVHAYELLFRDGRNNCFPSTLILGKEENDQDTLKLGLDDISCQKTSFINFQYDTLLKGLPNTLDPQNVVVEVDKTANLCDGLVSVCRNIKQMGFRIAIADPHLEAGADELLTFADIVKVDVMQNQFTTVARHFPRLREADVKLVAEQVETQSDFLKYKDMGFDFFQGYFFSQPETLGKGQLPASKLALFELIAESSKPTLDFAQINSILERDVSLSYMLLRFINNPMVNKRYKINSLSHALNYMGEVEIKKFVALLALTKLNDNKPSELLHLSLVRAKFCDLLAQEKGVGDNPPTGFMVGLFSLLDALLDENMQDVVAKLPIVDEVKFALCGGQNDFALYLMLVRAFESATWMKVIRLSGALKLDQTTAHDLFNQSIKWGNGVRRSLSPHFPSTKA